MKRNNRFTKRFLALLLVLCFALGQINLPAGLIKLSPDFSFLHTKAAGIFTENINVYNILEEKTGTAVAVAVPFHFSVVSGNNVTLQGVDTSAINAVGSAHLTIPSTISHNGTTYTITALGVPGGASEAEGSTDALRGCTSLTAVDIPYTVKTIYAGTFGGDISIKAVRIEDTDTKPSQLTTIGKGAFQKCFQNTNNANSYPEDIAAIADTITLPKTMTSIGENAFESCTRLKTVTIADDASVALAKQAFANLSSLETATLPNTTVSIGEQCFYNCPKLATLTNGIPNNESFTTIPKQAFAKCNALKLDVVLSQYITSIGAECFSNCSALNSVDFSASQITSIPEKAFYQAGIQGSPNFNDTITSIGTSAFEGCSSLCKGTYNGTTVVVALTFPASLSSIGDAAFKGCSSIGSIKWTAADSDVSCNIASLGTEAFASCTNLDNFIVPETSSLTEIPDKLLMNCTRIGRIMIPTKITKIGSQAFMGCSNFSEYFYYKGNASDPNCYDNGTGQFFAQSQLTSIGDNAFKNTNIDTFYIPANVTAIQASTFENCSQLDNIKLHNKITKIEQSAFFGCTQLGASSEEALTIPASVEIIGTAAFEGCASLKGITFAGDLEALPDNLFKDCSSLQSVSLPSSIVALPNNTFSGDTALESLTMPGFDQITAIAGNCFLNCRSFKGFNNNNTGEIIFPATLSTLGANAFSGCKGITSVDLGATQIASISNKAFADSGLTTIVFSKKLSSIAADAFKNCKLGAMTFQNISKVPTVAATAFKSEDGMTSYLNSNIVLTVPDNLLADFKKLFNETLGFTFTSSQFKTVIITAENISLSITPNTLYVGQKGTATIKQDGSEGANLYSSDEDIIKIVDGTTIEAVALGSATITAKTASGVTSNPVTVKVTPNPGAEAYVKNPITSITSSPNKAGTTLANDYANAFFVGDEMTITVNTNIGTGDSSKKEDTLVWTLSQVDNAHPVTDNGTTVSNGYVSITYSQRTGSTATATVKALAYTAQKITATCSSSCVKMADFPIVISPLYTNIATKKEAVSVEYSSTPVDVKSQFFTFTPSSSPEKLQWSSSNPAVATIAEDGKLTCVSPGQTTITVTSIKSGISKALALTVTNDITQVQTADNKNVYEVVAGQPLTITANATYKNQNLPSPDSITWTSSDEKTATITVTPSGTNYTIAVKTLKAGSANIIGKNSAGQTKCTISIRASKVTFDRNSFSLYTAGPNKKGTIKIKQALPSDASVSYAMADSKSSKIASVSSSGVISGKKKGSAKVNVTVYGVSYTVNVNVTKATLTASIAGASLNKKKTQFTISKKKKKTKLTYSANYLGSVKKKVSYKSSKKSVATISKKGVIKLKKKGTTKITITVNGVKKTYKLKVKK